LSILKSDRLGIGRRRRGRIELRIASLFSRSDRRGIGGELIPCRRRSAGVRLKQQGGKLWGVHRERDASGGYAGFSDLEHELACRGPCAGFDPDGVESIPVGHGHGSEASGRACGHVTSTPKLDLLNPSGVERAGLTGRQALSEFAGEYGGVTRNTFNIIDGDVGKSRVVDESHDIGGGQTRGSDP